MLYSALWYGKYCWIIFKAAFKGQQQDDYNDPYLKLMSIHKRVPHW